MWKTIREVHCAFEQGALSPLSLVQYYLQLIEKDNSGSFLTVCSKEALVQAEELEKEFQVNGRKVDRKKTPLFAIPIGIKDILVTQGIRTTCASRVLENYIPPYTATAVVRLQKAGAIILGKLNMDEFAMGSSSENSAFYPVKHPTHPNHVAGGSSGGPAAAVRAGLCFAALGTDTGGSIRLPAHYCGITGVKPTYGRVSRYGMVSFASSLDQIGPMTNSVEDASLLLDVMSGCDSMDATSLQEGPLDTYSHVLEATSRLWKGVRLGIPKEYFVKGLSSDVERSIQQALDWFKSQGAILVPVSLPHTSYSVAVYYFVAVCEASSNLARFDGIRFGVRPSDIVNDSVDLNSFYEGIRSLFGSEVKRRILLGTFALSSSYAEACYKRACQVRRKIKEDFDQAFKDVDIIVGPVSPTTAFRLGEKLNNPLQLYLNDIFTIPVNLAGLPAMSVPCGEDSEGLPIGLHLVGPLYGEKRLLSLANAFFRR